MAFATGVTMLVIVLLPVFQLCMTCGPGIFEGPLDYQESGEFRWNISNRLSDLLGVATGGMTFSVNGYGDAEYNYNKDMAEKYGEQLDRALNEVADDGTLQMVQEDTVAETAYIGGTAESIPSLEAFGGNVDDYLTYLSEQQARYEEKLAEYGFSDDESYYGSSVYRGYLYTDEKSYMEDMAKNKNLRYVVIYQNKLLYSNIEEYETKTDEEWKGEDFAQALDSKVYNFTLWYNREGDGKVKITKDGRDEDVYGDGLYTDASRWRVPGYANYKLGDKAKDAVIFLAAAKDPQRYLVAADKGNGYQSYGGGLYRLKSNADYLRNMALRTEEFLTAVVILLAIALLMRKSRRQAMERIADLLGKLCLECKFVAFVLVFAVLAARSGRAFRESFWFIGYITYGFGYYGWDNYLSGDLSYQFKMLARAGVYLAIFFWLFYLAVLDWRKNGKKQKKPILNLLKIQDLKYPIQKRLVKRQRLTLIAELVLLTLFLAMFVLFEMVAEGNVEVVTLTNADSYEYAEVYAMAAEYGMSAAEVGAPFLLIMELVFAILFIFTLLTVWDLKKNRRLAVDIGALTDQILAVRDGSLTKELTLPDDSDLGQAADSLNQIQKGMETALKEQIKSERMKVDLVTNVSHDIKTPLTSIISYTELLRQEEELPRHVKEYIQILGEKAERLRGIVQDVFEVSKATSGQLPIQMETLDLGKLLRQTLADMNDRIEASSLTMRTTIPEVPVSVTADGQRLYRVFQNLLQNALRYSLEGSRVYLTLAEEARQAVVRIKNTSGVELADSKDFTERFVRGDESRTDGGSGLGLSIAKSFTEACGGSLSVETDADLFTVTVCFNRVESAPGQEEIHQHE